MEYFPYLFVAAIIVFPWFIISKNIEAQPKRQQEAKKKAIQLGHVVTAEFVRSYSSDREEDRGLGRQCEYRYFCDGKTYKYIIFTDVPPRTLPLYYLKNPRKAAMGDSIEIFEKHWFLRFILVAAILILIAKIH